MSTRLLVSDDDVRDAIRALEYKAMMEAGQSVQPDLIDREETHEWRVAQRLRRDLQIRNLVEPL